MILSDKQILNEIEKGLIKIEPFDQAQLGTNSYDVRLGATLAIYADKVLDCAKENEIQYIEIPPEGYRLDPGILYLGSTLEYTESLNHVPLLEGCSSIGRLGVNIHATAGFGDVGFKNHWTLELSVVQPVRIYAGQIIGQLYWVTCGDPRMSLTGVEMKCGFLQTYDQKASAKYNTRSPLPQPSQAYKKFSEADLEGIREARECPAGCVINSIADYGFKPTSTLIDGKLTFDFSNTTGDTLNIPAGAPMGFAIGNLAITPIPAPEYPKNTVGYWLSKIEDKEIREKALAYAERNGHMYETEMLSCRDALCAMCAWSDTYEGYDYWEDIWGAL